MQPLSDVLVLDFSTLLPGPLASLLLAEAGADVVKVERSGTGEDMRAFEPAWGRDGVNFALLNRGKASLALDLKNEADRNRLAPLVARADVVIEQFRPGVMTRLGLGYADVAAVNPRIVYCSITGYGQTGPKSGLVGHDLNYIGDTGLLALSTGPAETPVVPPGLMADIAGGAYPAVMNILLALRERDAAGHGRHLDIAMADGMFTFGFWAFGAGQATGRWPGNADGLLNGGSPRYRLYPTRDGRLLAAAPIEQKFWDAFCTAIGLDDALRDDARDSAATARRVGEIVLSRTSDDWRACFAGIDCCCTIVASLEEALADPHFRARGLFSQKLVNERAQQMAALPVPVDPAFRDPADQPRPAPALGSVTAEDVAARWRSRRP